MKVGISYPLIGSEKGALMISQKPNYLAQKKAEYYEEF